MSKRFKVPNRRPRDWGAKTRYRAPQYLDVEVLPSGKLDAYEKPEVLPLPAKPLRVVCDCCLSSIDRCWMLAHRGFGVGWLRGGRNRIEYQAGWWGFCVQCWALFNNREIDTLVARVATLNEHLDPRRIADIYDVLAHAVYGPVSTWEAPQKLIAPIIQVPE